jgi:hypothetical protein
MPVGDIGNSGFSIFRPPFWEECFVTVAHDCLNSARRIARSPISSLTCPTTGGQSLGMRIGELAHLWSCGGRSSVSHCVIACAFRFSGRGSGDRLAMAAACRPQRVQASKINEASGVDRSVGGLGGCARLGRKVNLGPARDRTALHDNGGAEAFRARGGTASVRRALVRSLPSGAAGGGAAESGYCWAVSRCGFWAEGAMGADPQVVWCRGCEWVVGDWLV